MKGLVLKRVVVVVGRMGQNAHTLVTTRGSAFAAIIIDIAVALMLVIAVVVVVVVVEKK